MPEKYFSPEFDSSVREKQTAELSNHELSALDQTKEILFELDLDEQNPAVAKASKSLNELEPDLKNLEPEQAVGVVEDLANSKTLSSANITRLQQMANKIKHTAGNLSRKTLLASLIFATETVGIDKAMAQTKESPNSATPVEKIADQPNKSFSYRFDGKDMAVVSAGDTNVMFKHNIKYPESWTDLGKMLLEPVSIGISTEYGKGDFTMKLIMGEDDSDFTLSVDFPYEYARDFEKATPAERQKMEEEMRKRAEELLGQLLPHILSGSTQTEAFQKATNEQGNTARVKKLDITGYASSESEDKLNADDPRNLNLSGMRAENAATILQKIMSEQGIKVDSVETHAGGEIHVSDAERDEIIKSSHQFTGKESNAELNKKLLYFVEHYNQGDIAKNSELYTELEKHFGNNRKVSVNVEVGDKTGLIVVPLPLLLALLPLLRKFRISDYWPGKDFDNKDRGIRRAMHISFLPRQHGQEFEQELAQAERIGQNKFDYIQNHLRGITDPDITNRDAIKGYGGTGEQNQELLNRVTHESDFHTSQIRTPRVRAELDLTREKPIEDRVGALAFMLDRYIRMAPSVTGYDGENALQAKIVDALNVYNDPEAMSNLLSQILVDKEKLQPVHTDLSKRSVRFEVMAIGTKTASRYNRFKGGVQARRELIHDLFPEVYVSHLPDESVKDAVYHIDVRKLWKLADEYRANVRVSKSSEQNKEKN